MPVINLNRFFVPLIILMHWEQSHASISANFISTNSTRMTFMVNFDISSVICQKSTNPDDLVLYPISALCDGIKHCNAMPNMDDESFPFCSKNCNPSCGERGTCLLDGGKAQCYCDQGYSGKTCTTQDTNECAKKPCHWLAKCTNTYGSYFCSCLPGFTGDGVNCTDIDECAIDGVAKKCPANSECSNVPGTYFCNCTDGFRPRGVPVQECIDIDECKENASTCPAGTVCQNSVGSYKCVPQQNDALNCSAGYEIRDGKCEDIDECKKSDSCALRATCVNTPGSFHCDCPSGFVGDGKTCTPLTDCSSNPSICHSNAFCVSDLRMCLCQSGYIGDGISCFDMNECASDHAVCKENEKCINTNGSFVCCPKDGDEKACLEAHNTMCSGGCGLHADCIGGQCLCKSGYTGNPVSGCTDINECDESPNLCPAGQWCVNFDGGHVCCYQGAPVSKCQGLVVGVWRKKSKSPKKATPIFDAVITSTPVASVTSGPELELKTSGVCTPSHQEYCKLKNRTCTIMDGHPECFECLPGLISISGECILSDTVSKSNDCNDPMKNDCHPHAICLDLNPSGHLCACKDGFIGDGKRCDDVDECYTPNLCSSNAKCINQIGSFRCVCKPGFVGDGRFCTAICPGGGFPHLTFGPCRRDLDNCPSGFVCQQQKCCPLADVSIDCDSNPRICGDNAKCMDKQCVCFSGYARNGSKCDDMDECADPESVCEKGQKCFNLPGNFACCPGKNEQDKDLCINLEKNCTINPSLCQSSHRCVNGQCLLKDPDDCHLNHTLCHPNAECNSTDRCRCTPGYIGDGRSCNPDPNDCFLNVKLCDLTRSRCVDRRCQCLDGFVGNGTRCQSETCDHRSSICHRNADCVRGQCSCKDGFIGNGLSCIPDPNDCESYPNLCHSKAYCKLGRCHCNDGFHGDGKSCSPVDSKNCLIIPEVCGANAFCNQTRCHCKVGYLGQGESGCWADPEDCILAPSLCPAKFSECIERRCKCAQGFVGNGTHCALEIDCQQNKSICHPNAECRLIGGGLPEAGQWRCACSDGYEGDGRHCTGKATVAFDPQPTLLNARRTTTTTSAVTAAVTTVVTNATSAITHPTPNPEVHITQNSFNASLLSNKTQCPDSVNGECHEHADCVSLDNARHGCQCRNGFSGDGHQCEDINECALRLVKCHPLAVCINSIGGHMCLCPQGYKGDGVVSCIPRNASENRDRLDVECKDDGIVLLYTDSNNENTSSNFNGRIFVKTQSHNPYCSKDFTSSDGPVYKFKAPFAYCDVKTEPHNTFSTVVVIQKHPLFVTEADEAYNLRCTYPVGELPLMSHFNVSMLSTVDTFLNNGTMPQCSLRVLAQRDTPLNAYGFRGPADDSLPWQEVSEATVGQRAQLILNVEPKELYGIIARNCMAVNMDSGESYQLTNSRGCALDAGIFPEWIQNHKYELYARFSTFKWPDTAHVRFQCDCSPCFDKCEPVQCGTGVGWGKRKRSVFDQMVDDDDEKLESNPVFSSVLRINDNSGLDMDNWRDQDDQQDIDNDAMNSTVWLLNDAESSSEEEVCIHSVIFAMALGLAVSLAITICTLGFRSYYSNLHKSITTTSYPASVKYSIPWFGGVGIERTGNEHSNLKTIIHPYADMNS